MDAARALGYYWPTTCGGDARCTTCLCDVQDGAERLSEMGRNERRAIVEERGEAARLFGDVQVYKEGVRPPLGSHFHAAGAPD